MWGVTGGIDQRSIFLINIFKEKTQNLRIRNESSVVCLVFFPGNMKRMK